MNALWRAATLVPIGVAIYALLSHLGLTLGWPLSGWLLPAAFALAAGICTAVPVPRARPAAAGTLDLPAGRAVPWVAALILVLLVGAATFGAVATLDREWDGLVSWSLRALYLAPPADLTGPFFTDAAVLAHTKSYPMLQPLCLGACQHLLGPRAGRVFFPAIFVAFVLLVGAVCRVRGTSRAAAWCVALAFGATPMWLGNGSGAVDSGYAELTLGFFLAVAAAGLWTASPVLVASALFCLPLTKPEGLPYGLLLCAVTALSRQTRRRVHIAATLGFAAAVTLWIPLQARTLGVATGPAGWLLPVAGAALALAVGEARRRWSVREWIGARAALAAAVVPVIAVGVLVFVPDVLGAAGSGEAGGSLPSLRAVTANLREIPHRLVDFPQLMYGFVEGFLFVRKFGLLFPLAFFLLFSRSVWAKGAPQRSFAAFFSGGLAMCCLAIFLAEDTDWATHFESRFDRLLLQWVGVGWVLVAALVAERYRLRSGLSNDPQPAEPPGVHPT